MKSLLIGLLTFLLRIAATVGLLFVLAWVMSVFWWLLFTHVSVPLNQLADSVGPSFLCTMSIFGSIIAFVCMLFLEVLAIAVAYVLVKGVWD